jgi:hypothetical protein
MGWGNARPNRSWFKIGFPSGYVTDVLQTLEVLTELGYGADPRLARAYEWVLSRQDRDGRWRNEYPYNGKTLIDTKRMTLSARKVTHLERASAPPPPRTR